MPPRSTPSERQRRLGAELAKLRKAAGLSGEEASAVLGTERTRISHIEAGRVDVPRNGLYKLLRAYGCPEGAYFDGLMDMAQERGKGWWDEYRDVIDPAATDLAELEARSSTLRLHEPLFVPGILQTEAYAAAILAETEPETAPIERHVQFRMDRQHRLLGPKPAECHAIIHEAALHVQIGGPKVMHRQLRRLIEAARLPNVTIQIFPFEAGPYSAYSSVFAIFGGIAPALDTVYLEHPNNALFLHAGDQIERYGKMFERLSHLALAPVDPETAPESHEGRDSLTLIQHVMYAL
jgi:transcriptional regulator with XRE-family HTH domain